MTKDFPPERMDEFFDTRAEIYDHHMLVDLKLNEFYEKIASLIRPGRPDFRLLDLGCGTGIELERLFAKYPEMQVTGVDLSAEMLKRLRAKFPGKSLDLICGSYFDLDFGNEFDIVLSAYSLHHFPEDTKCGLYQKIRAALLPGGIFLFGDYIASSQAMQDELMEKYTSLRQGNTASNGEIYHFDIPFTVETEIRLIKEAGFKFAQAVHHFENASIIIASDQPVY
ncbi:MAG: class I SAM-dependent methyltransferase [Clostridiales bacterium]|jgi:tRNA (cmo5U34)-methyltransferase|nr:class I SAM-dependent methyltransferase [Clostridiales bacterium]